MGFTVNDLVNQKVFPDTRIVAGKDGADNEILWVNIMEILDAPKSVQPGELLVTTGYGLENEDVYRELLPQLTRRGVCAIAIQTGYYIETIPPYLIEQGNALHFPILSLPKYLTFSEILHTVTQLVSPAATQDWNDVDLRQAFSFLEATASEHTDALFPENKDTCVQVFLLESVNYQESERLRWKDALQQIRSLTQMHSRFCAWHELPNQKYVFISAYEDQPNFLSCLYDISIKLTFLSERNDTHYYLGVDQLYARSGIVTTLRRAKAALRTLHDIHARRGTCTYQQIKVLKMLDCIHDRDRSIVLDNQSLQLIFNYDRANGTNYAQTLRVYLSNNGNITQTARQLFLHRHTLTKRLEKIESIGNLNLGDYYGRIYLSISILFHDYFIY